MDYSNLLDPKNPLMERFKTLAPGSVKHCQNVAHICEAVASELPELKRDLLHVAALFHDVGKLMAPQFFSENQGANNPHDELPPRISYELISQHIPATAALMAIHEFPNEVIQIASQHHGNTIVEAFARKAEGEDPENYRYKWDTPTSTEAAVLMIADKCEAKAKSLAQQGKLEDPAELVQSVIDELNDDSQIDVMTLGVMKTVKRVLSREVRTIHHKREAYPEKKETEG